MTEEGDAYKRTHGLGWSKWQVFVGLLGVIFVVLPAVDFVLAPDYENEASLLRGRLVSAQTQADFVGVAKLAGLGCREKPVGDTVAVLCARTSGKHIWNWTTFLDPWPDAVFARGEFIDGRKTAEYQVTVERLDPRSF